MNTAVEPPPTFDMFGILAQSIVESGATMVAAITADPGAWLPIALVLGGFVALNVAGGRRRRRAR
jgi:hypothetical protein